MDSNVKKYPLVSVIIPTYNRKELLCKAIDSVLNQTYKNIEIIVIDDGSTDNTFEITQCYNGKIVYRWQENKGVAAARNHGVKLATGVFLAFLDSDDTWHPQKIEIQQNLLELAGDGVSCCLCDTAMIYPDRKLSFFEINFLRADISTGIWTNVEEVASTRLIMLVQAMLIRRPTLEFPLFNERFRVMEDYELSLRLAAQGPWVYTSRQLVNWYSNSPFSLSMSGKQDPIYLYENIQKILFKKLSSNDRMNKKIKRNLKIHYLFNTLRIVAFNFSLKNTSINYVFTKLLFLFIKSHEAFYRRSNFYPKPNVVSLNSRSFEK